jgi:hypothetical protein
VIGVGILTVEPETFLEIKKTLGRTISRRLSKNIDILKKSVKNFSRFGLFTRFGHRTNKRPNQIFVISSVI